MTKCTIPNCSREIISKGLCNAHYLRQKKGKDMNVPVQQYNKTKICIECGEPTKGKGGLLRCQKHYTLYKRKQLKAKLVENLGGKCSMCHGIFPSSVYDFHHEKNKIEDISKMFLNRSEAEILKEAEKCILLCANCHRIHHHEK
jgi:hypothetical protein